MMTDLGAELGNDGERSCLNRHLVRDLEVLWGEVLKLSAVVEESLRASVQALCAGKIELAEEVRAEEPTIDRWQVLIEHECLRILALHQPVASDLRRVTSAMKISNELERMGDLANHIARRARKLARRPDAVALPPQMEYLAVEALGQVRDALDALSRADADLARNVIRSDRQVDYRRGLILKDLKAAIRREPNKVTTWLHLINAARNLERVADHATNIAETVVYLREGTLVRRPDTKQIPESA
ncbi:phosphate signaling complex protein PhoU [Tautonia sociabilis]|uniref:Phosphate-specific transport system accessory protein PhoU n=1 Tax=Tautonia sociabilis TaxID=2080755 RepID=A0A432MEC4_9BACT|nr:phosphate signaling complex protein PhoU [Tautonia sociabilis]RUL83663.1 phosphate signaling complex protein PhoU [Tautonia sociabilis]